MSSHKYRRMAKDKCASNLVYSHIWLHVPKDGSHFSLHVSSMIANLTIYKKTPKKTLYVVTMHQTHFNAPYMPEIHISM